MLSNPSLPKNGSPRTPVLCFDLDGTLLDEHERIHPADLAILQDPDTPAVLIPCTGRLLESVGRTLRRNGLYQNQAIPLPLVMLNGSLIYAGGEEQVAYCPFEAATLAGVLEVARRFPQVTFLFQEPAITHMLHATPFGQEASIRYESTTCEFTPASAGLAFSKIMCMHPEHAALLPLDEALAAIPVERAFSMPFALELTPRGVDKASGLRLLLEHLGLQDNPLIAAGDGGNDLPLFDLAQASFAPLTTAHPEVRRRATHLVDMPRCGLLGRMLEAGQGNF